MGYRLNHFDEPVFMAVPKPMHTEFGIHHTLESVHSFDFQLLRAILYANDKMEQSLEDKNCLKLRFLKEP